jgi:DNA-binding NarL/FixJ family response regulator
MRAGQARRILLVDDHVDIREGLARMLTQEGVGCCSEAAGRQEALEAVHRELPDLALVDMSPGTEEALLLVAELSARNIPVLVCSMHEESGCVRRALAAGARGYITKREASRDLSRAVRDVLDGWTLVSPRAAQGLR